MSQPLISVILPVHNEAAHVRGMVEEYEQVLARVPHPHELILVTNGCRDDSPAICQALAGEHAGVRAVDSRRGAWGLAVKIGFREARGDFICYTNLARTTAEDLTLLLLYAVAYPNVVIKANRKIRESWRRRLGSLLYNLECRALFDLSCWDINGTPKVFPRAFGKLLALTCENDLIDAEFNVVCRRENYPVIEVPIFSHRRHSGKSTTNYYSAARMYLGAYRLWRDWSKTHP
jgi:glycosyltransferase involved in cell wall biosynthesis